MHPAASVIFFTTASGAGYGLLALLGLLAPLGVVPGDPWFGGISMACSLGLISAGLLASTAHLGHPERAWRALTQWRTSWLSREGVASLVTYVPAIAFGAWWFFSGRIEPLAGLAAAVMAIVTIVCTAMIYASLKPIRQWANSWVLPVYGVLALMTGALWLNALLHFWNRGFDLFTAATILVAGILKYAYWFSISRPPSAITVASATSLKGQVRFLEAPHTEANYLLKEMGYRLARKHSKRLRRITLFLGFVVPFLATLIAMRSAVLAQGASVVAVGSAMLGVLVERWLFFAEAKHTVTLYYGAEAV